MIFDNFKDKNDQKVNIHDLQEIMNEVTKDNENELLMILLRNMQKNKEEEERLTLSEFVDRLDE